MERKMNKYIIRRWIAFGIITIIFSIAAFRIGYNDGFQKGVNTSVEYIENNLEKGQKKSL